MMEYNTYGHCAKFENTGWAPLRKLFRKFQKRETEKWRNRTRSKHGYILRTIYREGLTPTKLPSLKTNDDGVPHGKEGVGLNVLSLDNYYL